MTRSDAVVSALVAALVVLGAVFFVRSALFVSDMVTDPKAWTETAP